MRKVELEQAKDQLAELTDAAASGEDVLIERGDGATFRIVPVVAPPSEPPAAPKRRVAGLHEGSILYMAPDFDDPLPDSFWLGEGETWRDPEAPGGA